MKCIERSWMPTDYRIMLYLAKRLRWAARELRSMKTICPDSYWSNLNAYYEARNAYYGAKETYLRGRGRYPE